ncbi:MAG: hypothetical protein P0Y53_16780 [Candidatus Pseudobacter hemicellulosilyticus]|uniref:NAD-dependent epimerase/dehydratase domain-containing protein n=1 Tax=Candidatus Pseudobacter hemicellulosilyticus TaxID=3121375 RepID=A0AAJ6BE19_9BACT|nr:MAG: hypothetical protein P0Y53_16780 [Pseudobacter sp.]
MVIGNGLVAGSFGAYAHQDQFLVFASGVSNSKSGAAADYEREKALLLEQLKAYPDKVLVYFSTTSVDDPDLAHTDYVQHKLRMEALIAKEAASYQVFRLSNLAGRSANPNTILNYFYRHISEGLTFVLWQQSERNIIDVADVYRVADHLLQQGLFRNQVVNIANTSSYPVGYIVERIEAACGRKGVYTAVDKGARVHIDTSRLQRVYQELGIQFGPGYLDRILEKYYVS